MFVEMKLVIAAIIMIKWMLLYIANVAIDSHLALTVCAHLPMPFPAPSPPRQFNVTSPTPFSLNLSWIEPLDDGGNTALVSVCMEVIQH